MTLPLAVILLPQFAKKECRIFYFKYGGFYLALTQNIYIYGIVV